MNRFGWTWPDLNRRLQRPRSASSNRPRKADGCSSYRTLLGWDVGGGGAGYDASEPGKAHSPHDRRVLFGKWVVFAVVAEYYGIQPNVPG